MSEKTRVMCLRNRCKRYSHSCRLPRALRPLPTRPSNDHDE
jgi:hypothetical protein